MLHRSLLRSARIAAVVFATFTAGCTMISDPAVRLMRCIHEAAATVAATGEEVTATCQPRSRESFTVILHPTGIVADSVLVAAGLDPALLDTVHFLRSYGRADKVFVVPGSGGRPSFTSIGWRQAVLPNPLVVTKPAGASVQVVVREGAYGIAVVEIH